MRTSRIVQAQQSASDNMFEAECKVTVLLDEAVDDIYDVEPNQKTTTVRFSVLFKSSFRGIEDAEIKILAIEPISVSFSRWDTKTNRAVHLLDKRIGLDVNKIKVGYYTGDNYGITVNEVFLYIEASKYEADYGKSEVEATVNLAK